MPSLDRLSFMVVFLGLPLAIYVVFVIYPFGRALYYSMTDWSGFTPTYNFVGLDNFTKLFHDDIFMRALRNKIEPEPARPRYLLTDVGVTYRLINPPSEEPTAKETARTANPS